jgi:hypothetical protein
MLGMRPRERSRPSRRAGCQNVRATSPAAPDFSIKPTLTGEKVVLRPSPPPTFPSCSPPSPTSPTSPTEVLRYEDEWIDATVMSILDHDWARHRGWPAESTD